MVNGNKELYESIRKICNSYKVKIIMPHALNKQPYSYQQTNQQIIIVDYISSLNK